MKAKIKTGIRWLKFLMASLPSLIAIGTGVMTNISQEKIYGIGFYTSLSVIIIQVLQQQYAIRKENKRIIHAKTEPIKTDTGKILETTGRLDANTNSIKDTTLALNKKIKSWETVLFPAHERFEINSRVVQLFKNNPTSKMRMKIICYGTSKYGGLVDAIKQVHSNTEFEIIVCSANSPFLTSFPLEKDALKSVSDDMAQDRHITLWASTIPPTIRASLISKVMDGNREHDVWCSVQPYYIFLGQAGHLFRGENFSFTTLADEKSSVMADLSKVFDREFTRLKDASIQVTNTGRIAGA